MMMMTQPNTEDSNAGSGLIGAVGGYGSIRANRLRIKHQSS
jgi:hypothetical protein